MKNDFICQFSHYGQHGKISQPQSAHSRSYSNSYTYYFRPCSDQAQPSEGYTNVLKIDLECPENDLKST